MFLSLFIDCLIIAYCLPFPECLFSLLLVLHPLNLLPVHRSAQRPGCDQVVHCLPFPECSTVCTPKTVYCLLIGCLLPPLPRLPSMLDLVHSQNGCLLHDYSLFVASLPKLPSMPDLVLTLCTPKTVVYGLFIACLLIVCCLPSQTSQHARPCAHLVRPPTHTHSPQKRETRHRGTRQLYVILYTVP